MGDGWRDTAKCVFALTFDVDAEAAILACGRRYAQHAMTMSHQAYGPEVGLPRLLEMLDELSVPATFFVPGWVAEQRPGLAAEIVERGHEVGHHSYSHRPPTDLTPREERADFERGLAVFQSQGIEIFGYRAAHWAATAQSVELIAEHGLVYDSSLMGDDRPYLLETPGDPVAELPVHWSLDDWEQYAFMHAPQIGSVIESPAKVLEMWRLELDAMRHYGCLFNLTCHPFLSGRAGRTRALQELLEYALSCADVRFDRCVDLARRALGDDTLPRRSARPIPADPKVYPDE